MSDWRSVRDFLLGICTTLLMESRVTVIEEAPIRRNDRCLTTWWSAGSEQPAAHHARWASLAQ